MELRTQDIFIGRQPILDRGQQLYAYELLFRSGHTNGTVITDDLSATATVLSHVFSELGIEAALGPYLGFVNLDARMLMSDALELLPRGKFVLEALETVEITPQITRRCRDLKDMGFQLALDDFIAFEEKHRPLLEMADIVKVDVMGMDIARLRTLVATLRQWPVRLLAVKVDHHAQVGLCLDLGFEYFQGYHFARPTVIAGKKLSQSELSLNRLHGLVLEDSDPRMLEAAFKSEPGLTLNLLRLTNSAASGVRRRITSVHQAIAVLGRRQLQRWLQLLAYADTSHSGGHNSPLLQLAASRGRFMELLAACLPGVDRDQEDRAFMAGILSLRPVLLQVPMLQITATLNIVPDVRAALETREGVLGAILDLCEAVENNDASGAAACVARLPGITSEHVNTALMRAMAWTNDLEREAA